MDSSSGSLGRTAALWTARGFAIGAAVHAVGWALLAFGVRLYGADYPWWHHAFHVAFDALTAWVAVRRPHWLASFLFACLFEQIVTVGPEALRAMADEGRVLWMPALVNAFVLVAAILVFPLKPKDTSAK